MTLLFWGGSNVQGQTVLHWSDLSEGVSFEQSSSTLRIPGFSKADFSEDLVDLEGDEVILTGYFLKLGGTTYMLSKNPMASCFFCGNGGPETVVGLEFSETPAFATDDLLSVRGILRLNADNPDQYYYRIEMVNAFALK